MAFASCAIEFNFLHRMAQRSVRPHAAATPFGRSRSRRTANGFGKTTSHQWHRYCAWGCFRVFWFADHRSSHPLPTVAHAAFGQREPYGPGQSARQMIEKKWSEREDLNLRPLVSQTSALTGLRHAPNVVPLARIGAMRKARSHHFGASPASAGSPRGARNSGKAREMRPYPSFRA